MLWLICPILGFLVIAALMVWLSRPMRIHRQPEREGELRGKAVEAYASMGRGPLFGLERFLVLHALHPPLTIATWLDIGCGPGFLTAALRRRYPGLKMIGLDNNAEMIAIARRNQPGSPPGANYLLADACQIPLANNSLDFAVTSLSLHHWKVPEMVFEEIKRVLKPGGGFLIFDLRRDSPRFFYWAIIVGQIFSPLAIRRTNGGVGSFWSSYTPPELGKMLAPQEFTELEIEAHFGWLVARGRKAEIN